MNIACYARYSAEKSDNESVENQFSIIEHYVKNQRDLLKSKLFKYFDLGFSGVSLERPQIQQLLTDVRMRKIDVVIVKDFSRLSRNYLDVLKLTESIFPFMKVRFIAVSDGYDSKHKIATNFDIITPLKSILNEFHSVETSQKLKKYFDYRLKSGEYIANLSYGYFFDKVKKVQIHKEKAAVIKEIFNLRLKENSCSKIAGILNEQGVKSPNGSVWSSVGISRILKNQDYIGTRVSHKRAIDFKTKQTRKTSEEEQIINENVFPPIVSNELFAQVQATFPKMKTGGKMPKSLTHHKLFCKTCGLTLANRDHKFGCKQLEVRGLPKCFNGTIKQDFLYELILEKVKNMLKNELEKFSGYFYLYDKPTLENNIFKLKENIAVIYEEYTKHKITEYEFLRQKSAIYIQLNRFEKKLEDLEEITAVKSKSQNGERYIDTLKRLYNADKLTMEHMKFVEKIIVTDTENIEIILDNCSALTSLCKNVSIYED
ncbi:recombinase [Clostridia bacterium]|nr:recombinase [Clostridia bacterium]